LNEEDNDMTASSYLAVEGIAFLAILAYMTILWLISLAAKDSSIVDIFWGSGFIVAAGAYFALTEGFLARKILMTALVAIWGLRLGIHIAKRNLGKGEDYRYRAWREEAGKKFWWVSFFRVFLLQGVLLWVISAPLLFAQFSPTPDRITAFDVVGAVVWGVGFFFEAIGDWQLARFKRNPENKGKLLRTGLWRYTRHPNYFGDATMWWGYFIIALGTPFGFVTLFSPIVMTVLLMRVSGVALLEKKLVETKPGYKEYIETTNAFFPWFPRKPKESS
jgi:steroid 5-alpha reductase family enzyme